VLFGVTPFVCLGLISWMVAGNGGGGDFAIFRRAGRAVVEGRSPYAPPTLHFLAQGNYYVYPAPFAYPFAAFAWMPERAGAVVFLIISTVAVGIAVRLLGARDWRCYGAAILTVPMFGAFALGAVGPLLLLLVAAGWRYRDRPAGGILLALAAAAKLFLWPLLVWLVLTRRWRATAASAATIAAVIGIWVLTDLHGLTEYPTTLRVLDESYRRASYSPQALALAFGASSAIAATVSILLAALGVGVIFLMRWRERDAFVAAVVVALFATPILWMHYLVLLIVPVLLFSPFLSVWWLVLVPLWATPTSDSAGERWRMLLTLAVIVIAASAPRLRWREYSEQSPPRSRPSRYVGSGSPIAVSDDLPG
jgi:hypothetical protein